MHPAAVPLEDRDLAALRRGIHPARRRVLVQLPQPPATVTTSRDVSSKWPIGQTVAKIIETLQM
jgi:hypothetical protein